MSIVFTYRPPRVNGLVKMHAAKLAAEDAAAEILLENTIPRVPKDTEQLVDSGHLDHLSGPGTAVIFEAVSDDKFEYGVYVHEVEMNHPRGGEDHYLLKTMHGSGPAMLLAMAAAARART